MARKIFSFGRPIIDITQIVDENKMFISPGGVEFNFTVNCAILGIPTTFYGSVGNDEFLHHFKNETVKIQRLELAFTVIENLPTARILITQKRDEDGNKKMINKIIDYGASESIQLMSLLTKLWDPSYSMVFSSLFSANTPKIREAWLNFIRIAKICQKKVIVSLAGMATIESAIREDLLKVIKDNSDIVFMNLQEFHECLPNCSDVSEVKRLFPSTKIVVITKGESGAVIFEENKQIPINPYPINKKGEIYEIGAGDAFAAGFVAGLINKKLNIEEAGFYAAKVASVKLLISKSNLTSETKGGKDDMDGLYI